MGSWAKKKLTITTEHEGEGEDRLSRLPDELIHKIYSFLDVKEAVQSSVLSKRWKLIWTTLPFITFGRYCDPRAYFPVDIISRYTMFIRHVFLNRNHQSCIFELNMYVPWKLTVQQSVSSKKFRGCVIEKFIQYALSRNVECLNIGFGYRHNKVYKLSTFSSKLLKKLSLDIPLEIYRMESDFWDLPALITLHLTHNYWDGNDKLPESWLTSLPALRTLQLESWDLSDMSFSLPNVTTLQMDFCQLSRTFFSLPNLTTLSLENSVLSQMVCDLPALLNLHLEIGDLPKNMSDMFSTLSSLKNLTLVLRNAIQQDHFISCPQLLNLDIMTVCHAHHGSIVVSAPQLCNFSSLGIFLITFEVADVENVDIKLKDWFKYANPKHVKKNHEQFPYMLSGLGIAKNLSFDLESIEALAENYDFLASCSSPFYNLKCVKLPKEYRESNIPSALRSYLLSASPGATIVTSLPRKNRISETVSVAAENVVPLEPLAAPTKELGNCQYINRAVSLDTLDMGVQEQNVMENSLDDPNRATQTNPPVVVLSNDRASSSQGNKDTGLWRGHEVNSEFVCLLDHIMHKYPETFEHFTTKNKKLCTMNLNMLCTSLNDFTKISLIEVDSEMIAEYRDVFAYLQNQGFNVSWLVNRLNYIENLRFSKPLIPELHAIDWHIDDAKSKLQDLQSKLQDLQALRMAKMSEIQNAFGTMGTSLVAGFIGDDLMSGL